MNLHCFAGVEYNNKIYFSEIYFNAFCELDLMTNKICILKLFDKEPLCSRLHRSAFIYKDQAWFIPQEGRYIVCVDLTTFAMTYYDVPYRYMNPVKTKGKFTVYSGGMVYEDKYLCLSPFDVDAVTVIDMEKHSIIPYYGINMEDGKKTTGVVYYKKYLYAFFNSSGSYKRISVQSGNMEELVWSEGEECISVFAEGEKVWLAAKAPKYIIEYNLETCAEKKIECDISKDQYSEIIDVNNKLVFLPFCATNFLIFDKEKKTTKKETFGHQEIFSSKPDKVMPIGSEQGKFVAMRDRGYVVKMLDEGIETYSLEIDDDIFADGYLSLVQQADRVTELGEAYQTGKIEINDCLAFFVKLLVLMDTNQNIKQDAVYGKEIWKVLSGKDDICGKENLNEIM